MKKGMEKQIREYTAIFEKNELGGFTVTVPSLHGLVTQGDNLENAYAMAKEAIECYLEGLLPREIPEENTFGSFKVAVAV